MASDGLMRQASTEGTEPMFDINAKTSTPEWGTPEYREHAERFSNVLAAEVSGDVLSTGGGCYAVIVEVPGASLYVTNGDSERPDGHNTYLTIEDESGMSAEDFFTEMGEGPQSVAEVVAAVAELRERWAMWWVLAAEYGCHPTPGRTEVNVSTNGSIGSEWAAEVTAQQITGKPVELISRTSEHGRLAFRFHTA